VIWTLRKVFFGGFFADWLGLLRWLTQHFLWDHLLELEERYPLWYTYCMSA
jgi:hypothetical protein